MSELRMPPLNSITIAGRLTRDPELKYIASGTALCNMSIANTRHYQTKSGEKKEETVFVDVQTWGDSAKRCAENYHKGDPVLIEGALKSDSWEDKQTGQKRTKLYINAEYICALSWGAKGDERPQQEEHKPQRASRTEVEEPPVDDGLPF